MLKTGKKTFTTAPRFSKMRFLFFFFQRYFRAKNSRGTHRKKFRTEAEHHGKKKGIRRSNLSIRSAGWDWSPIAYEYKEYEMSSERVKGKAAAKIVHGTDRVSEEKYLRDTIALAQKNLEDMCRDTWNWQKNNPDGYGR